MANVALTVFPGSLCPIDLFAVNPEVQHELIGTLIAQGIDNRLLVGQLQALQVAIMV